MKPQEFWDLAHRLVDSEPNAAGRRSSISRAYYGAFLCARELLREFGIQFDQSDAGVHAKVVDILYYSGDQRIKEASQELKDLKGQRNKADYRIDFPQIETRDSAELRLNEAAGIIGKIRTCRIESARLTAVRQACRQYAENILKMPVL